MAEVSDLITAHVPIGVIPEESVNLADKTTAEDVVYFVLDPMMGNIAQKTDVVNKTAHAIMVLTSNHCLL
ncbi:hypothetical protein AN639_07295 [Candidatus Epulonipiscium fishelsonii]|uniref:Uncharacterized protein n=1 Tax=Candidatus Epulonipiscium fishelsonii TaxID=77094 RepID=A0ACC8XA32_9FIRM|nr:hypothetical protein AN639_07295 [Epulopiscium sp. SCG-B05WGA-EpuloA1]ONI39055.1 hypothetical protein AN396_09280 [Epulopiscium sp. SCG-B11WGA-EpuloA1]